MTTQTERLLYKELRGRQIRTNILKLIIALPLVAFTLAAAFGFIVKAVGL